MTVETRQMVQWLGPVEKKRATKKDYEIISVWISGIKILLFIAIFYISKYDIFYVWKGNVTTQKITFAKKKAVWIVTWTETYFDVKTRFGHI